MALQAKYLQDHHIKSGYLRPFSDLKSAIFTETASLYASSMLSAYSRLSRKDFRTSLSGVS